MERKASPCIVASQCLSSEDLSEESDLILNYVDFILISRASVFVWSEKEHSFALFTLVLLLICLKNIGDILSWEATKPTKPKLGYQERRKKERIKNTQFLYNHGIFDDIYICIWSSFKELCIPQQFWVPPVSGLSLVTESALIVLDFGNSALHKVTFKFTMHH